MGHILKLDDVRLSYPKLDIPDYFKGQKQSEKDKKKWTASFHIQKNSPLFKQINAAIDEVLKAKFDKKWQLVKEQIERDSKAFCWQDGKFKEYPDVYILNANRREDQGRPQVIDQKLNPIYKQDGSLYEGMAGKLYAGMYVNAQVELWAYDKPGPGLSCTIMVVQAFRKGDAFGGASVPDMGAFSAVADGTEDEDELS